MMIGGFAPTSLDACILWKRLNQPFRGEAATACARALAHPLIDVCKQAQDRMKLMPAFHPEFTLHDETHLLRVTELMSRVIPEKVLLETLNPVEIALLILAAHFHDVGMVPDAAEAAKVRESQAYLLARDNWLVEFPTFQDALRIANDPESDARDMQRCLQIVADHEQAIFQRVIRDTHAQRSAELIKSQLRDDARLNVGTGHLADTLALLCVSHNWPPTHLTMGNGFLPDKAIGTFTANLPYLACVLRLADVLDFDRERTPDELFRCISFTNPISLAEWQKHRSVEGWKIDRDAVRFECACERPEYERAIHKFLEYIDEELASAHEITRQFPAQFSHYCIDLPIRTDRSRISAKDGAYLQASDLEITLGRDEIIRLLMTEKLYGQPSLAIRELLQNAWDALRHRAAIIRRDEQMDWSQGRVDFEHGVNAEGREYVKCTDNGVGMDKHIIKSFLLCAGRSYYRSPDFQRERNTFRHHDADFDPCARFGIGFMSVFMLGDQITIATRRYGGHQGGLGEPLVVEINGLGGLIVLRKGRHDQPAGTTIEVVGRRKPERFLSHQDRVQLVNTIYAYALAGEFPVTAKCTIPEIADEISLPTGTARPWHQFAEHPRVAHFVFEQEFSEIDSRLGGTIVCAVPSGKNKELVVSNEKAGWRMTEKYGPSYWVEGAQIRAFSSLGGRTCIDGILVAGPHGRGPRDFCLVGTQHANPIDFGQDFFILDVRGDIKPELTPHRSPPDSRGVFNDSGPGWRRLRRLAAKAHGRLWEKLIKRFSTSTELKALWQLLALHHVRVDTLQRGCVWEYLHVPSLSPSGELSFRPLEIVNPISFTGKSVDLFEPEADGMVVGLDTEMAAWKDSNGHRLLEEVVRQTILGLATLVLEQGAIMLTFQPPDDPEEMTFTRVIQDSFSRSFQTSSFGEGLDGVLGVVAAERLLNRRHPVVAWLLDHQAKTTEDPTFAFLHSLALALVEEGAMEALATGNFADKRHNWHFSLLGYYFRRVDLEKLSEMLQPPYRCWHANCGFFDVSLATLKSLAEIQTIDWRRRTEGRYV